MWRFGTVVICAGHLLLLGHYWLCVGRSGIQTEFWGRSVMDNCFRLDLSTDAQEGTTIRDKALCIP
jgi:hypothetical protein